MKNSRLQLLLFFLMIFPCVSTLAPAQDSKTTCKVIQDTLVRYKDGTYAGQSRASYTSEPFWGIVHLTVKNGSFTGIYFTIRDSSLHETFDGNYAKHYQGIPEYVEQCRKDWNGVQIYPKRLSEIQDPDRIDALSGATWSYNIFKASLNEALKNAR
jgi:major membrane immunogen (membrane-anchored lipoprotein)